MTGKQPDDSAVDEPHERGMGEARTAAVSPRGGCGVRESRPAGDGALDRVAAIIERIFAMPVVIVSDGRRFRAERGTSLSGTEGEPPPLADTPDRDQLIVVPDTETDADGRSGADLAARQGLRAYALAPLGETSGGVFGALFVGDHRPRQLDEEQQSLLLELRDLIEQLLADEPVAPEQPAERPGTTLQDAATGLPCRELALDRLEQAMLRAGERGRSVIVAVVGVRRLASVLSALDHRQADQTLAEAQLFTELGRRLRALAPARCTIARLRREQFAVIVPAVRRSSDKARLVHRFLRSLPREIRIGGLPVRLLPRVGVSVFPDHGDTAEMLLARATAALPGEHTEGENPVQLYRHGTGEGQRQRVRIESLLRAAIDGDALRLVYQPKIDVRTGRVASMEALLRWRDPELGDLPPDQTIAAAQRADLMLALTDWILRTACEQARRWAELTPAPIPVAVNLTRDELGDPDFARRLIRIAAQAGVDPARLEMEVTEGSLILYPELAVANIRALRGEGVRFLVDDFGKGYSWFDYLRVLPVDGVKIDRSFVSRLASAESDAAVVEGIIALARGLDAEVIAEGVETREQLIYLKAYRCDHVQGYWFAPPMEAQDAESLLASEPWFTV